MLNSISWMQFLTVVSAITVLYYIILALLYYRSEIQFLFTRRADDRAPTPQPTKSSSLVGKVREEEGITEESTIASDELNLADPAPESALLGPVADLLKELKGIIDTVSAENIDKAQCIVLIKALLVRYPQLFNSHYQKSIDLFIYENGVDQFSFDLSMKEIQSLWPNA